MTIESQGNETKRGLRHIAIPLLLVAVAYAEWAAALMLVFRPTMGL